MTVTVVALLAIAASLALGAVLAVRRAVWSAERAALRALAAFACVVAAGGLSLDLGRTRMRIVALDLSRSLERGRAEVLALGREAWVDLDPEADRVGLVLFGADVVVVPPTRPAAAGDALVAALARAPDPRGSDVGRALRAALDQAGGARGAEVVLVSDGRDTSGRALEAAAVIAGSGVVVHALSPSAPPLRGARLARLEVPARAEPGVKVPVVVEARASRATEVTIMLEAGDPNDDPDDAPPMSVSGTAGPHRSFHAVLLVTAPAAGGALRLRARVEASGPDDAPEDDALEAVLLAGAPRRALLIEGASGAGEALARALTSAAAIERVEPAAAVEALRAGDLDVVVVVDVPASALDPLVPALERAVESGATLVLAGARAAFGPGGWAGRTSESLAPVTVGPGDERERPLGLVLALDASGSMADEVGATSRFEVAVNALAPVLDVERGPLRPNDLLGVIAFAEEPTEVRPLAPLNEGEGDLRALLGKREPTGGTDIGRALVRGLEALGRLDAESERLLVLASDGGDQHPGVHEAELRRLAATLPKERLSVLAILVGVNEAQRKSVRALLQPLADAGLEPRIEDVADAGAPLRDLVEGELRLRTSARREGSFAVIIDEGGRAQGLRLPATISAYAPAKARPGARVLAHAQDPSLGGDALTMPIVVLARRGLGRVAALLTEPGVAADAVASLGESLLPAPRGDATLEARRDGQALDVIARGGRDPLPLGLEIRVSAAEATPAPAKVSMIGETPERARGRVAAVSPRALTVTLVGADERVLSRVTVPDAAHDETASDGPDHALLASITAATGGRVLGRLPPPATVGAIDARPLAPIAALVALIALLLDAAVATWRTRRAR